MDASKYCRKFAASNKKIMTNMQANLEQITKKQHLLLAIRAALVTGEKQAFYKLVKEYRSL